MAADADKKMDDSGCVEDAEVTSTISGFPEQPQHAHPHADQVIYLAPHETPDFTYPGITTEGFLTPEIQTVTNSPSTIVQPSADVFTVTLTDGTMVQLKVQGRLAA